MHCPGPLPGRHQKVKTNNSENNVSNHVLFIIFLFDFLVGDLFSLGSGWPWAVHCPGKKSKLKHVFNCWYFLFFGLYLFLAHRQTRPPHTSNNSQIGMRFTNRNCPGPLLGRNQKVKTNNLENNVSNHFSLHNLSFRLFGRRFIFPGQWMALGSVLPRKKK